MRNASTVSGIWPALEKAQQDLAAVAAEQGVSEVLLLTIMKDFCDRRLMSSIDSGK